MDLDRIRSACDLAESHVRTIAAHRRARIRRKVVSRAWPFAGAALAAGLSVLVVLLSRQYQESVSLPPPLVAAATVSNAESSDRRVELVSMTTVLNGMKRAHTIT